MNKLLKYTLSSTLLMGVAFADNQVTGDPLRAPVGSESGGGGTAVKVPGGRVIYLGSGKDEPTPLVVVADDQDKKCDKGSIRVTGGVCEANPADFGGKKGYGSTEFNGIM
ncbi:MAG: hypothetical protein P8L77_05830 [Gammaproteobacteria bacterium]|nr:hypothetical protein [Gammaproteobacteria bacterium]